MKNPNNQDLSMVPITLEFTPEEFEAIEECAAAEGVTVDELIRRVTAERAKQRRERNA
jgi:hypothetical protein